MTKAIGMLSSGNQPSAAIEVAAALQGIAVYAFARLPGIGRARIGRMHAFLAAVLGIGSLAVSLADSDGWIVHVLLFLTQLALIGALFWLGGPLRQLQALGWASSLPRQMGMWALPVWLLSGIFAGDAGRFVELPHLLGGAAWMALGLGSFTARRGSTEVSAANGTMA